MKTFLIFMVLILFTSCARSSESSNDSAAKGLFGSSMDESLQTLKPLLGNWQMESSSLQNNYDQQGYGCPDHIAVSASTFSYEPANGFKGLDGTPTMRINEVVPGRDSQDRMLHTEDFINIQGSKACDVFRFDDDLSKKVCRQSWIESSPLKVSHRLWTSGRLDVAILSIPIGSSSSTQELALEDDKLVLQLFADNFGPLSKIELLAKCTFIRE